VLVVLTLLAWKEWIGSVKPEEALILQVFSNNWQDDPEPQDWELG
jgi:hypothetical protein